MTQKKVTSAGVILSESCCSEESRRTLWRPALVTQRSLVQEKVGERSSDDFHDPLKVPVAQRNSKQPLPPLAMLRDDLLLGQGELKRFPAAHALFLDEESGRKHQRSRA